MWRISSRVSFKFLFGFLFEERSTQTVAGANKAKETKKKERDCKERSRKTQLVLSLLLSFS